MSDFENPEDREHSSIVGGSTASRMMNCPGHYPIVQALQARLDEEADAMVVSSLELPPSDAAAVVKRAEKLRGSLNQSSKYADEGTGLHAIMEYLVAEDVDPNTIMADPRVDELFDEYELKDDRMNDAVIPAYRMFNDFLERIMNEDECEEIDIKVESRVLMPGIEDGFGTCDILIRTPRRTVVWDWKFGAGVPVAASYKVDYVNGSGEPDPYDAGNDQLMFYARAARETFPEYFEGPDDEVPAWKVHLVICQPRTSDEISEFITDLPALEAFRLDLIDAVEEATTGKDPELKMGKWCNFAPCKSQCPLHLNGAQAMANVGEKLQKLRLKHEATEISTVDMTPTEPVVIDGEERALSYPEALSMMLQLGELVEPYVREAQKQAHAFMEAGGQVPFYKLVPKRAGWDSWKEPDKAEKFLARQGLSIEQRRKPVEPITPAKARDALKAAGGDLSEGSKLRKQLDKYIAPGVSSGTTIAPSDDPRPAVTSTAEAMKTIAEKLSS